MKKATKQARKDQVESALVQVAHLYYDENLSQQEIADRLKVSRSLIALYLQRAKDSGIVRIQIVHPDNACNDLAAAIKDKTGVRHITVVPNPRGSGVLTARAVVDAAAGFISDTLRDGDTVGLAWGRTVSLVVDLLKPARVSGVEVLSLMGESGHSGMHSQMNQLVMRAAENLRATPYFLSLPMVVSSAKLRAALADEAGIREVIARWNKVDLACVGIGVVPPVPGMVVYIGEEHLPQLIRAGAIGDVCGIYYDRHGRIVKSGLENRIIGATLKQLKAVGCLVAVAFGEDKADSAVGALRTGLLSALFIDKALAERMLAQMHSADGRKEPRLKRA